MATKQLQRSKKKSKKKDLGFPDLLYPKYDENDVAEILGVSVRTVQGWRSTKDLGPAFVKVGPNVRYTQQALIDYIEKRTVHRG